MIKKLLRSVAWGLGLTLFHVCTASAQATFSKDLRERITQLKLSGIAQVQLHAVARDGKGPELAAEIERRGGIVRFRADDIDYLRVEFPLDHLEAVDALAALPTVEAISASLSGLRMGPAMGAGRPRKAPEDGQEPATPLLQPYRPLTDLGGLEWQRQHPTFDGRGVGIGMLDDIPDLLHPNLQHALDLRGHAVPKFIAATATGNVADDKTDPFWVRMNEHVTASSGRFSHDGRDYLAPHDGAFEFGILSRPTTGPVTLPVAAAAGSDAARIPVLWDVASNTVWVDTNADNSFADEHALQSAETQVDIGTFGRDDPGTPLRESIGFTVTIDREARAVRLNPGWAVHGTMVAGSAAAEGFNGGSFTPVAGMARLGVYQASPITDAYNIPETVYRAMQDPRIDLVFYEWNFGQFADYTIRDGHNAISIALDRTAARFRKLLFVPADNAAGVNRIAEFSVPKHTISVASYDSGEAMRSNFAADSPYRDNLSASTSFGPGGNGALKPDVMAPSGYLTTDSLFASAYSRRLPGHFQLPQGVIIGGGTSGATPTAASAAALLISAAKQEHVRWDDDRLRFAIYSTARPLEGIPAYQQGRGLIQIDRAWEALEALSRIDDWQAPRIDVDAPVKTAISHLLPTPDRGVGLYEREGWRANQKGTRVITFTRRNGPSSPVTYQLQWLGDVAAFTSNKTLTLPLNKPVALRVAVATREPRVYSAILRLKEPGVPVESLSVMTTVVAANALDAVQKYSLKQTLTVRRPGVESVFVYVPPGTAAIQTSISKNSPESILVKYLSPALDREEYAAPFTSGVMQKVVYAPAPGVWELLIDNRTLLRDYDSRMGGIEPRPQPLTPTTVDIEVKLLRVGIDASSGKAVNLRNLGAPFAGKVSAGVGSELEQSISLSSDTRKTFEVEVPKGSRLLYVQLDRLSNPAADVTLMAFENRGGTAFMRQRVRGGRDVPLAIRVSDPSPGVWRIVIDPGSLPSAGLQARYRDVVVHGDYGKVTLDSADLDLGSKAQWRVPAVASPATVAAPTQSSARRPVGTLSLAVESIGAPNSSAALEPVADFLFELQ